MAPNIVVSRPTFPTYLLPNFNIVPFRRRAPRRTSSASEAAETETETASTSPDSTPDASQVPSLSSSPTSSTTDETATPPNSPPPPTYQDATTMTATASIPDLLSKPKSTSTSTTTNKSNRNNKTTSLARTHPDTLRCSTCSCDIAFASQIVSKGFTGRYGRAYLIAPTVIPNATTTATTQSASGGANNTKNKGSLANVRIGKCENRQLVTGWHVVADITCVLCSAKLGWKYVDAKELSQKYKVGKFILEVERVVPFRSWEDVVDVPEEGYSDDEECDASEDDDSVAGPAGGVGSKDEDVVDRNGDDGGGDDSAAQSARKDASDSEVEIVFDSEDEDDLEDMFSGNWDPEVVAKRRSRRVATARKK
ncbi:hypothetical protein HER10_EVM0003346 [Colletotrichum scovillei]|uniref:Yippee family protein n=1 Tax=Colletotrichum scovillei TaxID=1209932 RepID=A0A9P7UFU6_9PEZI|nr:uncharacterized protein HER10_EVM0003346 [Colletotrichum scovillei]KAF4785163.1 hypothetical protein HER10_EVM0003346 [Colletotrichum scovillei]KAG7055268.1 Yippee family protein [Colletotrichum scovillei]KAG7074746.1 Yippee family protein [Colletotrichum scovillei]KAG7081741.1 Yippee family protein [Colletotrichum scovillei]